MPALSPTMERGNLAAWKVREGDEIKAGMVLAEVETDKASMAWECQEEGFIARLLVKDGARDMAVGAGQGGGRGTVRWAGGGGEVLVRGWLPTCTLHVRAYEALSESI